MKISICERKDDCKVGDYYRDQFGCYYQRTTDIPFSRQAQFKTSGDPTANLVRKNGHCAFAGQTLVLCKVGDMRQGCHRTGSSRKSYALDFKSGSMAMSPITGYYGGPGRPESENYAYCAPGDVMAFEAETTVTTLSCKKGDKLTKDVKHGQTFVLDSGETVCAFAKDGGTLPPGKGWRMGGATNPPSNVTEMWTVTVSNNEFHASVWDATLVTGKVEPETTTIEGIARLAAAEKAAQVDADIGRFIIWSSTSRLPVTREYSSLKQATAVAVQMAEKNPGQKFLTARLVEEFTAERPVTPTLKRNKL